jgi:hypothetical protein
MLPPNGLAAIKATYGDFKWHPGSPPLIDIDDTWPQDNLVRERLLVGGRKLSVQLHRLVMPTFLACFTDACRASPDYDIRLLGGWAPRQMKTLDPAKQHDAPLSTHAYGCAFDVNWDKNPFSATLVTDIPLAWVTAFTSRGWNWGGNWHSKKDPMHFQFATGY